LKEFLDNNSVIANEVKQSAQRREVASGNRGDPNEIASGQGPSQRLRRIATAYQASQ